MEADDFVLIESDPPGSEPGTSANLYWKLLIVDDDPSVHVATRFALSNRHLLGRQIEFLHAHSATEALAKLSDNPDIALILLDVVMESSHAGLDLVRTIREDLRNNEVRIILRTGQPGYAPEEEVIQSLDINDYKLKTDLQHPKLLTCIAGALRAYRQIHDLAESRREIERQKRHLEQAQQLAQVGSWHLDIPRQALNWSGEALRLLGFAPEQHPSLADSLSAVHPDDRSGLLSHREALAQLDEYHFEFMTAGKVSGKRYLEHARMIRDSQGRAIATVTAIHDVTEARSQESRLRVLASALEQNPLPTAVLDAQPAVEYANAAFCSLFAQQSLINAPFDRLLQTESIPKFAAGWSQVARGQQWRGQLCLAVAENTSLEIQVAITPIRDESGVQRHFLLQQLP